MNRATVKDGDIFVYEEHTITILSVTDERVFYIYASGLVYDTSIYSADARFRSIKRWKAFSYRKVNG